MKSSLSNVNITDMQPLLSPQVLKREIPISDAIAAHVVSSRDMIHNIIHKRDERLLLIVGPCSIHDTEGASEYAEKIEKIAKEVEDRIAIVMRVYFEKPRTEIGWRGMIFDPHMNGSYEIEAGLRKARTLLCQFTERGIITATEMLDPIVPQYIDDLICWASIGARTTESQTHRELASGLSMAVGFKNGTDGAIETAVNAIVASRSARKFIGIDEEGKTSIVTTKGNRNTHLILRGGKGGGNYDAESITRAVKFLQDRDLPQAILIDCNHGNSQRDYHKQREIFDTVLGYRINGRTEIIGAMVESNLYPGRQNIQGYSGRMKYGVSITDACMGWDDTEKLIRAAYSTLRR